MNPECDDAQMETFFTVLETTMYDSDTIDEEIQRVTEDICNIIERAYTPWEIDCMEIVDCIVDNLLEKWCMPGNYDVGIAKFAHWLLKLRDEGTTRFVCCN
jgi:hypothetical protein